MINKEQFFKFMKDVHRLVWYFNWTEDEAFTSMFAHMYANYMTLLSGMDEAIGYFLTDYVADHEQLYDEELAMLYDYLATDNDLIMN